jgi:hypothetical protein
VISDFFFASFYLSEEEEEEEEKKLIIPCAFPRFFYSAFQNDFRARDDRKIE